MAGQGFFRFMGRRKFNRDTPQVEGKGEYGRGREGNEVGQRAFEVKMCH